MDTHTNIMDTVRELLSRMGLVVEDISKHEKDGQVTFVVRSPDSSLIIGSRGAHISALNHIMRRIVAKQVQLPESGPLNFFVDVNGYHEKLLQELKDKANILAGRARAFKTNVEMDPMTSYERMIIHTLFQDAPDIKTESVGAGGKRRVVIIYTGEK